MPKRAKAQKSRMGKFSFQIILIVAALAWGAWPFIVAFAVPWLANAIPNSPLTLGQMGVLGDLFGGINAFFTAAAFAAVWWTGRMQKEDLEFQQEELSETRDVLARQAFEATFFRMLEMLREIGNAVTYGKLSGPLVWDHYASKISYEFLSPRLDTGQDIRRSDVAEYYDKHFYYPYEQWLGPYFRSLYNLFKLLDHQEYLEYSEKIMYANIVRSQLSSHILKVLAVNACSESLAKEMWKYVVEHRLLKHLPRDGFREAMEKIYPAETFQDRPMSVKEMKDIISSKKLVEQARHQLGTQLIVM